MQLDQYRAKSGNFVPVYTLEIQTVIGDVDKILDTITEVYPLGYGQYQRNASISAMGMETSRPEAGSTTSTHVEGYIEGATETYPMVEIKISVERDHDILEKVMDAILYAHHYEEPVIFCREDWVSRVVYNPNNDNPNRWWNDGRGMPNRIESILEVTSTLD
jgi:hypothetical protein